MLAKKFALGFGIAVLLPMMIHYGVRSFSKPPDWDDYEVENYYERYQRAAPEEKIRLEGERGRLEKERQTHEKRFQKHLFLVTTPLGIFAIIAGSLIAVQAIGTGLMFGGIFCLLDGYANYWTELADWMRFLSLAGGFVVLVVIGYRKFGLK